MIDIGTIGATPSQISLNKILVGLGDKRVTNIVTRRFIRAKEDLKKLKQYVLTNDLEFYDRLLEIIRTMHMNSVKKYGSKDSPIPKDAYTHWRCVMTGLFREAKREIQEGLKENIRRVQRGQQPL
jgi:hypothetical protein